MADPREVNDAAPTADAQLTRPRAVALRAKAPRWLRGLGILAFARAVAIGGIAWFWVEHRDEAFGESWVIAWAVCSVAFELCAGAVLLITARGRVPWGVAVALALLAFGHLALGVVLFVGAGGFARAPEWAFAWGLFDNLVRVAMIVGVMWPVVLARADAIDARYNARSN